MSWKRMTLVLLVLVFASLVAAQDAKPILQDTFDDGNAPGRDGKAALAAEDAKCAKEIPLPAGANLKKGTIMFWLQPQKDLIAFEKRWLAPLVRAKNKGALAIDLSIRSSAHLRMLIRIAKKDRAFIRFDFTHLKAKKWYNMAFTWDSEKGTLDLYAAGHPHAHIEREPWQMPDPGTKLLVGGPGIAIDGLKLFDCALTAQEIAACVTPRPEEMLTTEGIQVFEETLADYPVKKELLYDNDFGGNLDDWALEGPGVTKIVDGRLYMESTEPEHGHIVFWNKQDYPADFLAEWDFFPANDSALYIIFFCAKGRNGKDIFDPSLAKRDGTFKQYILGDINAYHISYFRNIRARSGICNMRKEYGFFLVTVGKDPIPPVPGGKYHVTLLKQGNKIRFFIDGKLAVKFDDDGKTYGPVWGDGKLGLRQMAPSKAYYDNFRVYRVLE